MADRDSASESDSSSIDGGPIMMPPSPVTREQLQKRIESLQQHNRVLKVELETYKLRVKALQEENRGLRQASVIIVSAPVKEFLPSDEFFSLPGMSISPCVKCTFMFLVICSKRKPSRKRNS